MAYHVSKKVFAELVERALAELPEQFAQLIDRIRPWGFLVLYALLFSGFVGRFVYPISRSIYNVLVPVY